MKRIVVGVTVVVLMTFRSASAQGPGERHDLTQWASFTTDVWGNKAKEAPEGPTFKNLVGYLPPLQYVNAPFHHYPIVLSLKDGREKIRFVSNGSQVQVGINPGKHLNGVWHGADTALEVWVGENDQFGSEGSRLVPPRYAEGYLPIVEVGYRVGGGLIREECFAGQINEASPAIGAFLRISADSRRIVELALVGPAAALARGLELQDTSGRTTVAFNREPLAPAAGGRYRFEITPRRSLLVLLPNHPLEAKESVVLTAKSYAKARRGVVAHWQSLLAEGASFDVPEKRVMAAWRAMVLGNFMLSYDDALCYSAQNQYQRQYVAESGDAVMSLALLGFVKDSRRYVNRLLQFPRGEAGIAAHNAAYRLQLAMRYWLLTRDLSLADEHFDLLKAEADFILSSRDKAEGLIKEGYAGDTRGDRVYTINANSNGWRALRDFSILCRELGRAELAEKYAQAAGEFGDRVRSAIDKSMRRDRDPPFVPGDLLSDEKAYDTLTESCRASYYNLVAWYFLTSELYGPFEEPVTAMIRYAQKHGSLLLGLVRFDQHSDLYTGGGFDDLYGLPYTIELLRRREIDDFLVCFYGKLAHGMTRDTFINTEVHGGYPAKGEAGRRLYLPPNSSSNAAFLIPFRDMLALEVDGDRNGLPEELRLLSGTPRGWLAAGKHIEVRNAPTSFGVVSFRVEATRGKVEAVLHLPERQTPDRVELSLRLPRGERIQSVTVNGKRPLRFDPEHGIVDLSGLTAKVSVRAVVKPS